MSRFHVTHFSHSLRKVIPQHVTPRSRDETSVGQPVGARPVSLRNRESSAKPVAKERKR